MVERPRTNSLTLGEIPETSSWVEGPAESFKGPDLLATLIFQGICHRKSMVEPPRTNSWTLGEIPETSSWLESLAESFKGPDLPATLIFQGICRRKSMFEFPRTNSWILEEIPEMPQADWDFSWASLSVEKKEKQMRGCLVGLAVDACCQGCLLGFRVG